MKIGIDARVLALSGCPTGLYQYTYNLLKALQKIDSENEYRLFFNTFRNAFRQNIRDYHIQDNFRKINFALPHKITEALFQYLNFPLEAILGKIDIFHGLAFETFPCLSCKKVVTIHDTMFITDPAFLYSETADKFKKMAAISLNNASSVIANSEFTKNELIRIYKMPSDKISVVYLGIGEQFFPDKDDNKIKPLMDKYGITNRYLLYFGNIEPKKNIIGIIKAFDILIHSKQTDHLLVIAGRKTYEDYYQKLVHEISSRNLSEKVIFTDMMPAEEVPVLYNGANAFIFPSFYEGFGMPPLEAMACEIPVIVSDIPPLKEVSGDSALLVDPHDPEDIALGMHKVLSDSTLRTGLIDKGKIRASHFTWDEAAKNTIKIYEKILEK